MVNQLTLYDEIIEITEDYFGPAAPRFISRLMANHLHKQPYEVTANDLPELIVWIKLSIAMVTDDVRTIDKFITRIHSLCNAR